MLEIDRFYVTLTERCNMRCPHCWISAGAHAVSYEEISGREVTRAIDELIPFGLKAVKLTGGEPLVRKPVAYDIMEHCSQQGLHISLETNAVLVDKVDIQRISSLSSVEFGTSLDFPTAMEFDAFRAFPGGFARVTDTIKEMARTGTVTSTMAVFRDNLGLMEAVADLVVDLGASARFLLCMDLGRAEDRMNGRLLSSAEIISFYREVNRLAGKYPGRVSAMTPWAMADLSGRLRIGKCDAERMISLLPDGSISTCGIAIINTRAVLGNIRTHSIADVWRDSPVMCELRNRNQVKYKGVCGMCMFQDACANRCPAYAFDVFGSFDGPYPVCQRLYEDGLFPSEFIVRDRGAVMVENA